MATKGISKGLERAPTKDAAKVVAKVEVRTQGSRRAVVTAGVGKVVAKKKHRVLTEEEITRAAKEGKKIVGYDPTELQAFLAGARTLGEIERISKDEQYKMAEVGWRFLTEGKLEQGKKIFFGLVALDPFDAYFLTCLGSAHQQTKDTKTAEQLYSRALEINPYMTTARAHRGELRAMAGKLPEAIEDLSRVLKDDPSGDDPATRRAAVLWKAIRLQLQ